ncbi:MAG: hypothetical protein QW727_01330 [Candidatus Pacearchaeota archaeon]
MIIRGIGSKDKRGNRIIYLEEDIFLGDKIAVKIIDKDKKLRNHLIGYFPYYKDVIIGYFAVVNNHFNNGNGFEYIEIGDSVFGEVISIDKVNRKRLILSPLFKISELNFEKWKNKVFR